jgi:hypothetical protein
MGVAVSNGTQPDIQLTAAAYWVTFQLRNRQTRVHNSVQYKSSHTISLQFISMFSHPPLGISGSLFGFRLATTMQQEFLITICVIYVPPISPL